MLKIIIRTKDVLTTYIFYYISILCQENIFKFLNLTNLLSKSIILYLFDICWRVEQLISEIIMIKRVVL